jgi:cytoskeletal protein CcmA (bactofilin family)
MAGEGVGAFIGKSVEVRGEIRGGEDLIVEGQVEGMITLSESRLTIGANARVQANIAARDIVIQGTVIGEVKASGRVELRQGCQVTGDIHTVRLSIEDNAIFQGKVDLIQQTPPATRETSPQTVAALPRQG